MSSTIRHHRRGMTLVELLVVIAIIGLLAVAVLPNLANSAGSRKVRESARIVSGFVAFAQSQAIGSRDGVGISIELLENTIADSTGTGTDHIVALDLFWVTPGGRYAGEFVNSRLRCRADAFDVKATQLPVEFGTYPTPDTSRGATSFSTDPSVLPPDLRDRLRSGEIFDIHIGQSTQKYQLYFSDSFSDSGQFMVRLPTGSTTNAAPWPVSISDTANGEPFKIQLPPQKNPSQSATVASEVVIDLTYSVLGGTPGPFPPNTDINTDSPIQLLYTSTGTPATVVVNGSTSKQLLEPLYLLITSIEAIQENTVFTTSRSYWVAISPAGGIPRVAEVKPLASPPKSWDDLKETQAFIREASLQVGN